MRQAHTDAPADISENVPARAILMVTAALAASALAGGLQLVADCAPAGPLFDHAVLLADMLHDPPHLLRGHNEHRPVLPRLVFFIEAHFTTGNPRVPIGAGLAALAAAVWTTRGEGLQGGVAALVLGAILLRPQLASSLAMSTNVQYPLAIGAASLGLTAAARGRVGATLVGGVLAALSSAEGLAVLPLGAWLLWRHGGPRQRRAALWTLAVATGLTTWSTTGGESRIRFPQDTDQMLVVIDYGRRLLTQPWSLALAAVALAPALVVSGRPSLRQNTPPVGVLTLYGASTTALLLAARWWRHELPYRYLWGPSLLVLGGVLTWILSSSVAARRALGLLALATVLLLESWHLGGALRTQCQAGPHPGDAFWAGTTDDGTIAHPGYSPGIAIELRDHVWSAGLYRPAPPSPTAPPP